VRTKIVALLAAGALALGLAGCTSTGADVASRNISQDADNWKVNRRIVFINGITDKILFTVEGKCSINDQGNQLEVTCKIGPDAYKKHFLGKSNNVAYIVEQLESANVSEYHYKFTFSPATLVPDVEIR